jgi:hypothetical protein
MIKLWSDFRNNNCDDRNGDLHAAEDAACSAARNRLRESVRIPASAHQLCSNRAWERALPRQHDNRPESYDRQLFSVS